MTKKKRKNKKGGRVVRKTNITPSQRRNTANTATKQTTIVHKSTTAQNKTNNGGIFSKLISVFIKDHKDNNGGHPHVIVDNIDNKHVSVGLTTQRYKGKSPRAGKNYSLKNNPLNEKADPTYMRRQAIVDDKEKYYKPRTGKMDKEDYEKAKEYGEKAKQKYLDEKEQKK